MSQKKALVIRFSSFGDIVQSLFVADSLSNYKTDLLTKKEFVAAFENMTSIHEVHSYDKKTGIAGLFRLAKSIKQQKYDLIYDAHNNQRTLLIKVILFFISPLSFWKIKTRSKFRIQRFFLFKLRINLFPKPFKGALSFLTPLRLRLNPTPSLLDPNSQTILLAPSAAWDLKKWPTEHWIQLAGKLSSTHQVKWLGGPTDSFISKLHQQVPSSENLAGKLSWTETISEIKKAKLLISGDTGVLHVADYFSIPAIALMGPSAFGYPSRESSQVFSLELPCQPCSKDGRGKCKIKETQKCLTQILPDKVYKKAQEMLN